MRITLLVRPNPMGGFIANLPSVFCASAPTEDEAIAKVKAYIKQLQWYEVEVEI